MFTGAIKTAYNYGHYISMRPDKKILKKSMYLLLDHPEITVKDMQDKIAADEKRMQETDEYFRKLGWNV